MKQIFKIPRRAGILNRTIDAAINCLPFLSLVFLFHFQTLSAQISSSPTIRTLQFDLTEESYYTVEAGVSIETLSGVDRVLTQKKTEITNTEISIDSSGEYVATIDLLNSADYFADWPVKASRFIYDKNGYRILNQAGQVIFDEPTDSANTVAFNQMKSMMANTGFQPITSIPAAPNAAQTSQLQNMGIAVLLLDNGKYQVADGNSSVLYDPVNLRIVRVEKEGTRVLSTEIKEFQVATNGNYLVPSKERFIENVNRPSGACMQRVVKKQYQNYRFKELSVPRSAQSDRSNDKAAVYPNPSQNEITVEFSSPTDSPIEISIQDFQGRLKFQKNVSGPSGKELVDISAWPPGMYVVRILTGQNRQILKLLKTAE